MHRTRKTELLIRTSFGVAIALLLAILVSGYFSLARGNPVADELVFCASLLALVLLVLSLLALRRAFSGRGRAEAELDRFFSLSLDFLVIASVDGYFKRVSPAVTDVLGWTPEEFTSRPFMDFVHPEDVAKTRQEVERQMKSGERVLRFENRYRHKDGSWRVLSWRSMPEDGLMYATARDVTDSVEQLAAANDSLRKSERRFRALIEHGADSIALIDADNRILYLSPAVTNVEGYTPEELLGRTGTEHTHPDDLPVLAQTMEQMLANPGKPVPAIWRRRHKEGHWIWLEGVATNLLGDPSVGAIVCNYRDITGRLAHERRLGEQLQRLALLSRITRAIGERQDLRSIFQVVVRTLEDELPVDFCSICLYDAAQNQLSVSCVSLNSEPLAQRIGLVQETVVPIDENGLGRCITGHLVYEADIAASRFEFPRKLAGAGMRSLVIAPTAGGEPGVRRAGLRAARRRCVRERRMRIPAPGQRAHRTGLAPGAAVRRPAARPMTTCARPSSRSCSRSACVRSARWPAASRTTSTTRFRRCRCTPSRCWSAKPISAKPGASNWRPFSAPSTTWRRRSRAWASSIACASRAPRWYRSI